MDDSKIVFIIGPARSGTKMLRDLLASHQDIGKIPFDINFVWKYNFKHVTHDALKVDQINTKSSEFAKKYIGKRLKGNKFIVEKTVSNTLRVNYLKNLFPEAKFIYLIRDGRDVIESVNRQWGKSPSIKYIFSKLKEYPKELLWSYGLSYLKDLLSITLLRKPTDDYVWGVKYENYEKDVNSLGQLEFITTQWIKCVESMIGDYNSNKMMQVSYEEIVREPQKSMEKIFNYIGIEGDKNLVPTRNISTKRIGSYKSLTPIELEIITARAQRLLQKFNYL